MKNIHKRYLLFLLGCIPARLLLTYLAKIQITIISYITLIISLGFWYIYLTGSRPTGAEVFGERIWWNPLRPISGTLYLLYSFLVISKLNTKNAWILLLIDTILGLVAFLNHHFLKINF